MNDPETVEILHSLAKLMGELLHPRLRQLEASLLDVVEEVLASHVVEHDVVVVDVLEEVY